MNFFRRAIRHPLIICGAVLGCGGAPLWAAVGDGIQEPQVREFFSAYCVECHGPEKTESDLRLDQLALDFSDSLTHQHWIEVMDNLNLGEMPPVDAEKQPEPAEIAAVAGWIADRVVEAERQIHSTGGKVVMRRMNRQEYTNTIRDLLMVEFLENEGPMATLPPDAKIDGFDKVGSGLLLDPALMDAYFQAAREIVSSAIVVDPPRFEPVNRRLSLKEHVDLLSGRGGDRLATVAHGNGLLFYGARLGNGNINYQHGDLNHPDAQGPFPTTGRYKIRVTAGAVPGADGEIPILQISDAGNGVLLTTPVTAPPDNPQVFEATGTYDPEFNPKLPSIGLLNPESRVGYHSRWGLLNRYVNTSKGELTPKEDYRVLARRRIENAYMGGSVNVKFLNRNELHALYLEAIEIEGPIDPNWPSRSMAAFFPDGPADGSDRAAALGQARELFEKLLPRAYRRPLEPGELDRVLALVENELAIGQPYLEAIRVGLIGVLCSPKFLLLAEPTQSPGGDALDPFGLATRLSYFLWSSMPDDELFRLAADQRLNDPDVLQAEVDRMLDDPKAEAFITGFAGQWFRTAEFDNFAPDKKVYRDYYAREMTGLGDDMVEEPIAFFRELLTNDGSLYDLLDSDWTMLNERLASFYGIEGVVGTEFRRVALPPDSPRGGLLGMAGVHKWGSDGDRTKPVERGKYVLDVLFNSAPPPPPPNVGEVEPNIGGEKLTVRERLIRHQEIPSCAACHRGIDPYGLALENFNVIGKWRDVQDGESGTFGNNPPPIDASGLLPNGHAFSDFESFKAALQEQRERFLRGVTEKMLTFALGRSLEPADRGTVDRVLASLDPDHPTARQMLKGIVTAPVFQQK